MRIWVFFDFQRSDQMSLFRGPWIVVCELSRKSIQYVSWLLFLFVFSAAPVFLWRSQWWTGSGQRHFGSQRLSGWKPRGRTFSSMHHLLRASYLREPELNKVHLSLSENQHTHLSMGSKLWAADPSECSAGAHVELVREGRMRAMVNCPISPKHWGCNLHQLSLLVMCKISRAGH